MKELIKDTFIGLCKIRDAIESGQLNGEELALTFFTDEPEIISDLISELYEAELKLNKTTEIKEKPAV